MTEVFVSHPGLQHSHQLAWALHERGLLQQFWSGTPVVGPSEQVPWWLPSQYAKRVKTIGVPRHLRRHPIGFQLLLRMAALLPASFSRQDFAHRVFHFFDWWVARQLPALKPRVVVAFENSALQTFRVAKSLGALCILDAPSIHHVAGSRLMEVERSAYLAEINRRKDEEVELADIILTCSPLAAETYKAAGVPATKIHSVLLGATLPKNVKARTRREAPLHFVFAGAVRRLKGIDLILSAFARLYAEGLRYRLTFVGGMAEAHWIDKINETPGASYRPSVPQDDLFNILAEGDCLLLPSRFDSFGMVVAEALACGTPAIVSNQTGAKAMLEQFSGAGWVVECDVNSLCDQIRRLIQNPDLVFAARQEAFKAATHFTWAAYRQRTGDFFQACCHAV